MDDFTFTDFMVRYVAVAAFGIFILWLIREIVCWYLKINLRVTLQQQQVNLQKLILKELQKITPEDNTETADREPLPK